MSIKNFPFLALVSLLIILCFLRVLFYNEKTLPKNQDLNFEATITRDVENRQSNQVIRIGDLRVYAPLYPEFNLGDRIIVDGFVDVNGNVFKAEIKKVGERQLIFEPISKVREKIASGVNQMLPQREAALVLGTVLGLDTISADFKQDLTKTGTIHVVVVSGQNLMIVVGVVMAFARYLGRRKALALSLVSVFVYSTLAGFEPPVIRASLVVLASTLAIYFGREVNALWSLFLAGVIIILIWPAAILEISFQLTFAASLGIITLGQKLSKTFKRVPIIGVNGAVAISAFLFTLPIIVYYFGRVSLFSPIVNILVAEAVLPIMVLGFLISVVSLIFTPIASLLAILVYPVAFYFVQVVHLFAKIEVGQVSGGERNLALVVGFYMVLVGLYLIWILKPIKKEKGQDLSQETHRA